MGLATTGTAQQVRETIRFRETIELSSDHRIRRLVESAIDDSGYPYLRYISVSADRGCVVLQGKVPSYFAKQLAQTAAMNCEGVTSIQNELFVN